MVSLGWLQQGPRVENSSHPKPPCPWLLCGSPGPKLLGGSASGLQSKIVLSTTSVPRLEQTWTTDSHRSLLSRLFTDFSAGTLEVLLTSICDNFNIYKSRSKHRSCICVCPTCTQHSKEPALIHQVSRLPPGVMSSE